MKDVNSTPRRRSPVLLLESANLLSGLGNAMVVITLPWLVLESTGSPASAGLLAALAALPALLTSPITGWMVDHFGRRVVSVASDILSALAIMAIPVVALMGELTFPMIILLAIIGSVFDPAGYTARRALIPDAAHAGDMSTDRLNGIHEGVFALGWTAGPLLGSLLIASIGAMASFWAGGGLFLAAAVCVWFMRVQEKAGGASSTESTRDLRSLARGFVALWEDRLLRLLTIGLLILAAIYLPTETVLLTTYYEQLQSPQSLGLVIASMAGGATLGAFGYGWLAGRFTRLVITRMILLTTAAAIIPMAFLPPLGVMVAAGFVLGLAWGPFNPLMSTLVQRRIPASEQGRVYGVQLSTMYAAPPLAMVVVGLSVERWGVGPVYLTLAGLLAVTSLALVMSPRLRDVNE